MKKMLASLALLFFCFVSPEISSAVDKPVSLKEMGLTTVLQAWNLIEKNYVDEVRLDDKTLTKGLIKGLIFAIGDKHGYFLQPEDFKKWVLATHSGVSSEMLMGKSRNGKEKNIGYLKIDDFTQTTDAELRQALKKLLEGGADRLIINLRANTGGQVEVAARVCGAILGPDKPFFIKTNHRGEEKVFSAGEKICPDIPVVCLISGSTASAAEMLAGALRDDKQVPLIGEKSFGKGSMQASFPSEIGVIMITTHRWLTPSRTTVDGCGLKPDIKIGNSAEVLTIAIGIISDM